MSQQGSRARDDPSCGSAGCHEFNYEWNTHAWDDLHSGGAIEEHLNSLPSYKYGTKLVKNQAEEKPPAPKKEEAASLSQMRSRRFGLSQLRNDPIGSSVGITQWLQPGLKKPEAGAPYAEVMAWEDINAPRDYFVPSFGMDRDIMNTQENERVASELVGHAWSFKTPESAEKYKVRSMYTAYNMNPDLEDDMVDSQASTSWAENEYGRPVYGQMYATE